MGVVTLSPEPSCFTFSLLSLTKLFANRCEVVEALQLLSRWVIQQFWVRSQSSLRSSN